MLATLVGGCLAAASANVFNCVLDRDIDEQMRRTRRRPLPRHMVSPAAATAFGFVLGLAATLWLGYLVNWMSALLALTANVFYVFVYTMILKRRTSQNIVWGGIAGCFPPLIGWTAVTDSIALAPFILFAIVFFWTPPHTWALALRYREDYAGAGVPMLPVVKDAPEVARQILGYSVITVAVSLALWPIAPTGWLYPLVAGVAGAALVWESIGLLRRANAGLRDAALKPMRLFHWSNSYLALVFVAAAVDPLHLLIRRSDGRGPVGRAAAGPRRARAGSATSGWLCTARACPANTAAGRRLAPSARHPLRRRRSVPETPSPSWPPWSLTRPGCSVVLGSVTDVRSAARPGTWWSVRCMPTVALLGCRTRSRAVRAAAGGQFGPGRWAAHLTLARRALPRTCPAHAGRAAGRTARRASRHRRPALGRHRQARLAAAAVEAADRAQERTAREPRTAGWPPRRCSGRRRAGARRPGRSADRGGTG